MSRSELKPPYYAVVFSAKHLPDSDGQYAKTAAHMVELASQQDGYLGIETATDAAGFGITVSYWRDLSVIKLWREQIEHAEAQQRGRQDWYSQYHVRVCCVERDYSWEKPTN